MCGIFGIIGEYDVDKVKKSLHTMKNRGDDASKIVEFKNGCFAQNRLAITALDTKFNPPFSSHSKHFVFNGEVYNHKQLSVKSISDSYTAFEFSINNIDNFLQQANGMFALALYDEKTKILTVARDRFGKKPLYYTLRNNAFIFSSSIDAIKNHIEAKFNKNALKSYLTFRAVIGEETFYQDIFKLEAGHILKFDGKNIQISKYYDLLKSSSQNGDLQNLLNNAIEIRANADVEVASLLSGGVDSSTIAAIASNYLNKQGKKLQTFCVGYKGFDKDDERYYASLSAKKFNTTHHEIEFSKNNFLDSLENVILAFDEPIADQAALPLEFMCRQIKQNGIKCILSGEGGDEAFLGYGKYKEFLKINSAKDLPFLPFLDGYFKRNVEPTREWEWYKRAFGGEIIYKSAGELYTDSQKIVALNQKTSNTYSEQKLKKLYENFINSTNNDYSIWMSYIDVKIWLGEVLLQKADRVSMHNSIELRAPFMDHRVLKKCIDMGDLRAQSETKAILKNYMRETLPYEVLTREKKGFTHPFNKWLFEIADPEIVFALNIKTQFFNKKYLDFLYKNAQKGSFKHQFWTIYIFSKWYIKRFGL